MTRQKIEELKAANNELKEQLIERIELHKAEEEKFLLMKESYRAIQ